MDNRFLISLGAAMTLAAGSAFAVPQHEMEEGEERIPSFHELDRDGDGYVSQSEAAALPCLADNFRQINPENEEGLTRGEFQKAVSRFCR